jgi:hypothetical protein
MKAVERILENGPQSWIELVFLIAVGAIVFGILKAFLS